MCEMKTMMFRNEMQWIVVIAGTWGYINAQFSGTCLSETNIIHSDELISNFQVDCSQKQIYSCEFDGSVDYDPGIKPYRDLCYELDGQVFWYNGHWECTDDFTSITDRFFWLGLPVCLGKSCTLDDLLDQQENVWIPNDIEKNFLTLVIYPMKMYPARL